jgi:hypothetical protein
MKNTVMWCIFTCFMTTVVSVSIYKSFYDSKNTEDINEVLECNMKDDLCVFKANERTSFINDLTARSYSIEKSTG